MRKLRWLQFGLIGGVVLSLATGIKLIKAIVAGAAGNAEWGEAAVFVVAMFWMGFVCGLIAWAGHGLYQRIGMAGDAIVGLAVMLCFFTSCMLLFAPEMLGAKFASGGGFMFALATVVELIAGPWIGHDLRKELEKMKGTEDEKVRTKLIDTEE